MEDKTPVENSGSRIPTNLRALLILECLADADQPLTAAEIGRRVGLTKPTAHRLCQSLEEQRFLVRPLGSKRFQPSRRARGMGGGLLYASASHIARHQVLEDVARDVGETVNFVVPAETGMRYLDRVETDWPFRVQFGVGSDVPFHCTASGKTFMASLPLKKRTAFVAGLPLVRQTARTHTSPDSLLADLETTAERGYALDDQEFIDGMVAIAVPVIGADGNFIAALAFHGPLGRLTLESAQARKDVLVNGAKRLSAALYAA